MVYEDENHEVKPIQSLITDLQLRIEELQDEINTQQRNKEHNKDLIELNKKRIKEIELQIKNIQKSAQKLIDLTNQIILYQDTPHPNMISLIMSILSQDTIKDQLYTFAEKRNGELIEKKNRLRGTPNLFYTQVIDDTHNQRYEEKNRRFIHVTPDTSEEKIDAACELIWKNYGLLDEEYEEDVLSKEDRERACHIVEVIIAKLKQHSKHFEPKKTGVRIPFHEAVTSTSTEKKDVWQMTANTRIAKYLSIITKINMDQRPKIVYKDTGKFYVISTFEDVAEILSMVQRATSKMRPYQEDWFYKVFIPVYQDQNNEPRSDYNETGYKVSETVVGVTTEELSTKTAEVLKCSKPSTQTIRDKYLDPLVNIGLVNRHESRIRLKNNIYSPVDETTTRDKIEKFKVRNPDVYPFKSFLEQTLRRIVTYKDKRPDKIDESENQDGNGNGGGSGNKYLILDHEDKEITVAELVERYFSDPERVFTL